MTIIIIINPQYNPDHDDDDHNVDHNHDHNHDDDHRYNRDDHLNPPPPPLSAPLCSPASKRVFGEQPGKRYFLKLSKDFVIFLIFGTYIFTLFWPERFSVGKETMPAMRG